MKKGKIYLIKWSDTFTTKENGWNDDIDIKERVKKFKTYISSIGFYVGTFDDYIVLAMNFNTNMDMKPYSALTHIPKGTIGLIKLIK